MRLRATRNSHAVTCSIGISRRLASTSSDEDVLHDVLGVAGIGHPAPDEPEQPGPLPLDDLGDPLVLFECHPLEIRRVLHQ